MLTQEPTPEMFEKWKSVWNQYKIKLKPNGKSGQELLDYLSQKYILTEIYEKEASDGHLITSRGPATTLPFAYTLVDVLGKNSRPLKRRILYNVLIKK